MKNIFIIKNFFSVILFILIFFPSCLAKKQVKKDWFSYGNYLKSEDKEIKDEFYFFFQDLVPPTLIRGWHGIKNMGTGDISTSVESRELRGLGGKIDLGDKDTDELEENYFREDLYDQVAYPYLDSVIIEVVVSKEGLIDGTKIIKSGTPSQNEFCLNKIKKLRFNAAYLGGIRYKTKVQIVFTKLK